MITVNQQNIRTIRNGRLNVSQVMMGDNIIWPTVGISSCFAQGKWNDNASWTDAVSWRDQ